MFDRKQLNKELRRGIHPLPLRHELRAILNFVQSNQISIRTGLDIGFEDSAVSHLLHSLKGYWMTVEASVERSRHVAQTLGEERVLTLGTEAQLPFEDKQFDLIVMAHQILGDHTRTEQLVKECHRILKTGGLLIFTLPYRKRASVIGLLTPGYHFQREAARYNEADIFQLVKHGYDLLGLRFTSRFWMELVQRRTGRSMYDSRKSRRHYSWLYALARFLDMGLFWTRGYQICICARRKGWRGKHTKLLNSNLPVSDAVLFNPSSDGKRFEI